MKRQKLSNKSILHFFKTVPRASQESTAATTDAGTRNVSQTPNSPGPPQRQSAQTATALSSPPLGSSTSITVADAPTVDTVMTSVETLPFSTSQTSINSGASKRALSHGQQVVLNSDSDSDSDSIEELDFGFPAPKLKIPAYTAPARSSRRTGVDEPELHRPPKEDRNNGKRSFSQLLETARRNLEMERQIQKYKADLESVDEQTAPAASTLTKYTLQQAMNDEADPDQADRLYKAMQRTTRVQTESTYYFFENTPGVALIPPFPQRSLSHHGWTACFDEPSTRDQAFMTGFAHQIFRLQALPEELATWMIDQICLGRNAALGQKYLEILRANDEMLQKQLNPKRLDAMFKSIGAKVESLGVGDQISPSEAQADCPRPLPPSLKRIAALLTTAAPWLHAKARIHAFHLLCHTCLDDRLLLDPDTLGHVQDAMEAVICQYADNHKLTSGVGSPLPDDVHSLITSQLVQVIPKLLSRITNPLLQANLIHAFPARSPLTAYLQRHLALAFLFYPTAVDVTLSDARLPDLIHAHLETSPYYRTTKRTNYSFLIARLTLLDIAIGPGPLSVPYLPLTSPASSEVGSSPVLAPAPGLSEVKAFNKEVDALAQHIKLLGNSIVETGAALDLTIMEAKERCERVYWRLQHAVRIGGKKVEDVFGEDDEEKQLKVRKFFRPLPKRAALKQDTPKESIFDEEGDTELHT
ncbi:hypothetical protein EJ07DRAFT_177807 [Lizonia empirigonia]|nr:hypothetical protein EJ07DRAFT_177807 [Lizonia empirigonia]